MSFHPLMVYDQRFQKSERKVADEGPAFTFTPERRAALDEMLTKYPSDQKRSAILGALYLVQEQQGYLTANGMRHVAGILDMTPAEVEDVATYYVMFYKEKVGKYVLQVCRTLSCALNGAERVTDEICKHLHVRPGETDATGTFTVQEFECLGACDRAPVVMINNEHWQEHQRPEDVPRFLEDLRRRGLSALSGCHLVPAGEREPR
jgi:NADH-quinone oxidoreductase E subunit